MNDTPASAEIDPVALLQPRRRIEGISAILLPWTSPERIDWAGFEAHLARTLEAGLTPAVNMDTGFVQLLDEPTRLQVLDRTARLAGTRFVAGAFVADTEGAGLDAAAYRRAIDAVVSHGGTPVVFPSWGLSTLEPRAWVDTLAEVTRDAPRFIAFELGAMFVPYGRIYDPDTFAALLGIPNCIGAKHSSLSRIAEWQRLALRDRLRPDFRVYTGNDLAVDMVMYGSDYLLGLSTFAPDAFALRDAYWATGDARFHELNDVLQFLGAFAFRPPVPGYRHNAAQFLQLRGWIGHTQVPEAAPRRPSSDLDILRHILTRLNALL